MPTSAEIERLPSFVKSDNSADKKSNKGSVKEIKQEIQSLEQLQAI